jgi:hypothetical protein
MTANNAVWLKRPCDCDRNGFKSHFGAPRRWEDVRLAVVLHVYGEDYKRFGAGEKLHPPSFSRRDGEDVRGFFSERSASASAGTKVEPAAYSSLETRVSP